MENRMAAIAGLDRLSSEQVVEAANRVLAEKFEIADPAMAAGHVAALAGLDASNAAEIETLARKAAAGNRPQLGRLLSAALTDLAGHAPAEKKRIEAAVKSASAKQTVVGLDILALGYLLLCGYLAVRHKGRKKEEKAITVEETKDGRFRITIGRKTEYVSPFEAFGMLLGKIRPQAGDSSSGST